MRIEVLSKQLGYDAKNKVIELAKEFDFVRVYDVYKMFPGLAEATYDEDPDPRSIGWRSTDLRTNTVRVRSTASGQRWWLYFPEPDLPVSNLATDKETAAKMTINPMELVFEMPMSDKEKIDYFIDRLFDMELRLALVEKTKVRVKSKARNGYEKIEYGYYIDSDENVITKKDGTIIKQKLWIIKMTDNTVREVKPKSVIFGWGNEEEE